MERLSLEQSMEGEHSDEADRKRMATKVGPLGRMMGKMSLTTF